ncbi:low affinity iron permease family protein [Jatrophihabitans sp.]|uniref:low affinity iron permease family protein n=1 Tax=Jatrophihabitans sp. TaxID=1932789 RepID=UPI0030C6A8C9|nr:hypothetical protein [Jatrophihabitans sp.]
MKATEQSTWRGGTAHRRPGSSFVHQLDRLASRPLVAVLVISADVVWVICSATLGFPTRIDAIFQTLVAALTLALVFILQHTQSRQEVVTQRKLDEILRALPHADNAFVALEDGSDPELRDAHELHREVRRSATADEQRV